MKMLMFFGACIVYIILESWYLSRKGKSVVNEEDLVLDVPSPPPEADQ